MARRVVKILKICIILAISIAFGMTFLFVVLNASFRLHKNHPWAIGVLGGFVVSRDSVFVADGDQGRVYAFELDGTPSTWIDLHRQPISISKKGSAIIVDDGTKSWPIEDKRFRLQDPGTLRVQITRTWWGQPILQSNINGWRKHPLQPWYITLVQSPYPGGCWPAIAIILTWLYWYLRL